MQGNLLVFSLPRNNKVEEQDQGPWLYCCWIQALDLRVRLLFSNYVA